MKSHDGSFVIEANHFGRFATFPISIPFPLLPLYRVSSEQANSVEYAEGYTIAPNALHLEKLAPIRL